MSESAVSFKWVAEQLIDLAFYDCPEPALIIGDFSKGLSAAIAAKATIDLKGDVVGQTTVSFLITNEVVVSEENRKEQRVYL
jgi:hypothetical protein